MKYSDAVCMTATHVVRVQVVQMKTHLWYKGKYDKNNAAFHLFSKQEIQPVSHAAVAQRTK